MAGLVLWLLRLHKVPRPKYPTADSYHNQTRDYQSPCVTAIANPKIQYQSIQPPLRHRKVAAFSLALCDVNLIRLIGISTSAVIVFQLGISPRVVDRTTSNLAEIG